MNRIRFCQYIDSLGKGVNQLNHQGTNTNTNQKKQRDENEGARAHHILCITYYCVLTKYPQSNCHTLNLHCTVQRSNCVIHNNSSKNGPGTSWFPHESCWRRHRCKDQLPWSSGKIQYLLLLPVGRCRQHRKLGKFKHNMLNISGKTHWYALSENCYSCFRLLICSSLHDFHSCPLSPLEHSMIAGYIFKTTTMYSIKQVFSNQIVDLQYHLDNHRKTNTSSCSSITAVRVRLANQSAVLVHPWWFGEQHWGVALSPFGTSLGQLPWLLHLGLQKSPDNPCTRTASSSDSQPVFGLP